jgi:SM-20-related protein
MHSPHLSRPNYRVLDGFLDAELHASVLQFSIASQARFKPSLVSGGNYDPTRISRSLRDFHPLEAAFSERVRSLVSQLIAELHDIKAFKLPTLELEMVAYGDGAYFRRHRDVELDIIRAADKSARILSAVYYFHAEPKAFSGGALRLYGDGKGDFVDIEPEQNTLVVFPSQTVHEVMPISCPSRRFSDSRFAINCWVHG